MTQYELEEKIEKLVDRSEVGVNGILLALSNICFGKGTHVLEAWGDKDLARKWDTLGNKIDGYYFTIKKLEKKIW